jgi:hypothetical protein
MRYSSLQSFLVYTFNICMPYTYVCGEREGKPPCALAHLDDLRLGEGRGCVALREWFAKIRSLALQGRNFLLLFYFYGYLIYRSPRYENRINLDHDCVTRSCGFPIYTTYWLPSKRNLFKLGFCLFSLLCRHLVYSISSTGGCCWTEE